MQGAEVAQPRCAGGQRREQQPQQGLARQGQRVAPFAGGGHEQPQHRDDGDGAQQHRHRNIGKLVGMPVPGTMTSVSWERLQDPSLVFGIPVVGYRLPDGSYLENSQLEPDIKVANSPETIVKGEDTQLKVAVEELLKELDK